MKRWVLLVLAWTALALGAQEVPESSDSSDGIPFDLRGDFGAILITAQINGRTATLLVDTGSSHTLLKNRIYTGWYIIDKRCDPSLDAKVMRDGMKQGYRRKIARDPAKEKIHRHKVLDPPLVSLELFDRVQQIIEAKRTAKLREFERRATFAYHGFLRCSRCGQRLDGNSNRVYNTAYYCCIGRRGRRISHGHREKNCDAAYIKRDVLESMIDELISKRLTDLFFLVRLLDDLQQRAKMSDSGRSRERITATIASLSKERERVLKSFEKGYRSEEQVDKMIARIDVDLALERSSLGIARLRSASLQKT